MLIINFVFISKEGTVKKGSIPSIYEWAPEKVSLREEGLKIGTENISRADRESKTFDGKKIPMLLKESLPDCKIAKLSNPWRIHDGELGN